MTEKRNILIFENQKYQFDTIIDFKCLTKYHLLPTKQDFKTLIDNVRVWVNESYSVKYREKAIKLITDYVATKQVELIIMDHILGGAYHCLTGIDLAKEINNKRGANNLIPVLFLSKTDQSEKKRMIKYDEYKREYKEDIYTNWIHKGYFGDEILKEEYFESIVIPTINKLLGASEENKFWVKFDGVLNFSFPPNQNEKLTELRRIRNSVKYDKLDHQLKENIEVVFSTKDINNLKFERLRNAE